MTSCNERGGEKNERMSNHNG